MLNYKVEPELLQPLVPRGTMLDTWQGVALVTLVGFRFLDTRVLGVAFAGHVNFDEVNLRFYVRREGPDGAPRRGVVFLRELVPRRLVTLMARWVYHEPYLTVPMRVRIEQQWSSGGVAGTLRYGWAFRGRPYHIEGRIAGLPTPPEPGSEEAFVTERLWGFTRRRGGGTLEYRVEHSPWQVWRAKDVSFHGDPAPLFGTSLAAALGRPPRSALVADGSPVAVYRGTRIA